MYFICKDHNLSIQYINLELNIPQDSRLSCQLCEQKNLKKALVSCDQNLKEYYHQENELYTTAFSLLIKMKENLQNIQQSLEKNFTLINDGLLKAIDLLNSEFQKVERPQFPIQSKEQMQEFAEYLFYDYHYKSQTKNDLRKKRISQYEKETKRILQQFLKMKKDSFEFNLFDDLRSKIEILSYDFQEFNEQEFLNNFQDMSNYQNETINFQSQLEKQISKLTCTTCKEVQNNITLININQNAIKQVTCINCPNQLTSRNLKNCIQEYIKKFRIQYHEKYLVEKKKIAKTRTFLKDITYILTKTHSDFIGLLKKDEEIQNSVNQLIKQSYYPFEKVDEASVEEFAKLFVRLFCSKENCEQFQNQEAVNLKSKFEEEMNQLKMKKYEMFTQTIEKLKTHVQNLNSQYQEFQKNQNENSLEDQLFKSQLLSENTKASQKKFLTIDNDEKYLLFQVQEGLVFVNIIQKIEYRNPINFNSEITASCMQSDSQWFAIATKKFICLYAFKVEKNKITIAQNSQIPSISINRLHALNGKSSDYCFALSQETIEIISTLKKNRNWKSVTIRRNTRKILSSQNFCLILISLKGKEELELECLDLQNVSSKPIPFIGTIQSTLIDFAFIQNTQQMQSEQITIIFFFPEKIVCQVFDKFKKIKSEEISFLKLTKENLFCSQSENFIIVNDDIISLHQIQEIQSQQKIFQCHLKVVFSYRNMKVLLQQESGKQTCEQQQINRKSTYLSNKGKYIVIQDQDFCKVFSFQMLPSCENFTKLQHINDFIRN